MLLVHWQNARNLLAINQLGIESYVEGVLQSELNVTWPLEALKAQAVISRSMDTTIFCAANAAWMAFALMSVIRLPIRSIKEPATVGEKSIGPQIHPRKSAQTSRGGLCAIRHAASGGHLASINSVFPACK